MPSKNDLSRFKVKSEGTLGKTNNLIKPKEEKVINTGGRKPKPATEKQSEIIGLRFTKAEFDYIKQKAGLVQSATYIKDILFRQTDLFDTFE